MTDHRNVNIAIPRSELSILLAGALGAQRTLKSELPGHFAINTAFLLDLLALIHQRIILHHSDAKLLLCSYTITSIDGKSETTTAQSVDSAFATISPSIGVIISVKIALAYEVTFAGRSLPQRQDIQIDINTGRTATPSMRSSILRTLFSDPPMILATVLYTEVIWGIEILGHIERTFSKRVKSTARFIETLREALSFVMMSASIPMLLLVPIWVSIYVNGSKQYELRQVIANKIVNATDAFDRVNLKLDYLIVGLSDRFLTYGTEVILLTVSIYLVFFSALVAALLRKRSFLLLNDASIEDERHYRERRSRVQSYIIGSLLLGTLTGILSSQVTGWLSKWFPFL